MIRIETLDVMLNGYGIVTKNSEGNWREFNCIKLELQAAWKNFSEVEKKEMLEYLGIN
ncbi:hypothetical protein [Paenibacillus sp. EKM207P]|uniref:hypothetical protein n=1 Tax=Paenibacillus sp. EKM207P TaxID=1683675 RepID=UPI001EEB82D9|nr:hypothetical protein [Paenibacillus sp. EKM207P]